MKRILWLPYGTAVIILTGLCLLVYATVQQTYRSGADDPQIQLAESWQAKLNQGKSWDGALPDSLDLARGLGIFVSLYDEEGRPLRSSALLDGQMPVLPAGVLDHARRSGGNRITWQPRPGIRMAMVVLKGPGSPVGFIAVGRSLREVELRERNLLVMVGLAWTILIALVLISGLIHYWFLQRHPHPLPAQTQKLTE